MSTSGITFSGLSSGLDTDSIVKQLMSIKQQAVTKLQTQKTTIQSRQTAIGQVSALVASMQSAAAALDNSSAFSVVSASCSNTSAVSVSAATGAPAGVHTVVVQALARQQRIAGSTFASQTDPLGLPDGQIVINGHTVSIAGSDTLQMIAANINSAKAGVNATILSPASGQYRLVLASTDSGVANSMSIADVGSGTLASTSLGLVSGTSVSENSFLFSDSATSLGTLLGQTTPSAGTVTINGQSVAIDFGADTLSTIADRINATSGVGVTASVVAVKDASTGVTKQQLQLAGASSATIVDNNNILSNLGIVRNSVTNELVAARDASFSVDGMAMTRSSNHVTDALTGVTMDLLQDSGTPSADVTVATDTDTIKKNITAFVSSYNALASKIDDLTSFDSQTMTSAVLFGDVTVLSLKDTLVSTLTDNLPGMTGNIKALSQIGITLDSSNQLQVSDSDLSAALASTPDAVAQLFQAAGKATDSRVSYVSSTDKTVASATGGYAVDVTQVATQATFTGTAPVSSASSETLSFAGGAFGTAGYVVSIAAGSTLADVVSKLNSDTTLSSVLGATIDSGCLKLTTKQYGSAATFTVSSSQDAANSASGIGNTPTTVSGTDVAGTINGEAATGSGQFLTGTSGNLTTDGLQLRINSTVPGLLGTIGVSKGAASLAKYLAQSATDSVSGSLVVYNNSLSTDASDLDSQITDLQARLADEETTLRAQFTAMEAAVAKLKSASAGLSTLTDSSSSSSSSKTSSSSSSS